VSKKEIGIVKRTKGRVPDRAAGIHGLTARWLFLLFLVAASPLVAAPISIDWEVGDGKTSFNWQGRTWTLQTSTTNADHRVTGDSDGQVDFFMEESSSSGAKVSYSTDLAPSDVLPTEYSLGYIYGSDLASSTPSFSWLEGFLQGPGSSDPSKDQLLVGSDEDNSDSPFAGAIMRDYEGTENSEYLVNTPFGNEGLFTVRSHLDGKATSDVSMTGHPNDVHLTMDLTPTGTPDPYNFDTLLLQMGSYQDSTSFGSQFGATGQQFSFTELSIETVPEPGMTFLLGLCGLAFLARRRK
jgi:hypothetical protein